MRLDLEGLRLTPNFTAEEYFADRLPMADRPTPLILNAQALCSSVVQPCRSFARARMRVTSGYRPPAINRAAGGSPSSDHVTAEAIDLAPIDWVDWFRVLEFAVLESLPFDQWILEHFDSKGIPYVSHVSHRRLGGNRRMVLVQTLDRSGYAIVSTNTPYNWAVSELKNQIRLGRWIT